MNARAAADRSAESDVVEEREGSGREERVQRGAVAERAGCGRGERGRATRWKDEMDEAASSGDAPGAPR